MYFSFLLFTLLAIATKQSLAGYSDNGIRCTELTSLPEKAKTWNFQEQCVYSTNKTETLSGSWEFNMWSEASVITNGREQEATYWWNSRPESMMLQLDDKFQNDISKYMSASIFEIQWKTKGNSKMITQLFTFEKGQSSHKSCSIHVPDANYDFRMRTYVDNNHWLDKGAKRRLDEPFHSPNA